MSYEELLNIRPKYLIILSILVLLMSILLSILSNRSFYETTKYRGIYNDNVIYVTVPINYLDTLKEGEYVLINKKKYKYQIIDLGPLEVDSSTFVNYQVARITIDKEFLNNEVVDLIVYGKKEKLITKLKRILRKEY